MDKKSTPLPETNQDLTKKTLDSDKEQVQEGSADNVLTSAEESLLKEEFFDEDMPSEKTSENIEGVEDMPADMAVEKEAEEEKSSSKGSAVKKTLGVLVVVALAGGAYYAQQNQFFGLLGDSASEQRVETEAGSSGEQATATESTSSVLEANTTTNVSTVEQPSNESSASEPFATKSATNEQGISTEEGVVSDQEMTARNESLASGASTVEDVPTVEPSVADSFTTVSSVTESATVEPSEGVEVTGDTSSATTNSSTSETTVEASVATMPEQAETHDSTQTETELQHKVASMRLAEVLNLYQVADFERSVRVSKENTLKALDLLKKHIALQSNSLWKPVLEAINRDEQTLKNSADIDLAKLFKATDELAKLVKQAHFISAETGEVILHPESEKSVVSEEAKPGAWLDLAINQVERLSSQAYEAIRSDLGGLIRVEKLSAPDVATLPVERLQQLRQETLLQVSIAQEALLKRQQAIWQEATGKIEQLLSTYYNTGLESTQQALALVRQLMKTSIQSELPVLDNTHQALEQLTRQLHINK